MRRVFLFHLIFGWCFGIGAAQQVTVSQLERALEAGGSVRTADPESIANTELLLQMTQDADLAPEIARLQLTERLTNSTRAELIRKHHLGPLSQAQLELIADRSALLDPPAAELVNLPPPSAEEQKGMIRQAGDFIFQTLSHLPDFFALLTTTSFSDAALSFNGHPVADDFKMHLIGKSEREITFSEGREVFDSAQSRHSAKPGSDAGLQSQGEFGAEPATVFLDMSHGTIEFQHWEREDAGPVAVYRYTVPEGNSHYEVRYACRGQSAFRTQPGYRGTLSIDPKAGVVTRMTLETESKNADPISTVRSVIEYGPVTLGKHRYFCPRRSVAFSVQQADACVRQGHRQKLDRPVAMLNRILFTDYHRLGSEMEMVPEPPRPVSLTPEPPASDSSRDRLDRAASPPSYQPPCR